MTDVLLYQFITKSLYIYHHNSLPTTAIKSFKISQATEMMIDNFHQKKT